MMKPIVIFSCLLMILASCSDEGGGRASPPSSDGGLTDDRDGGAADPDAGPRADAGPPDGATLQNDGDRFRISYPAFAHGTVSEYRLYSMRNATDPSRVMVDRAPPGQLEMRDPYVYDGVSVFYRVYAVVAGTEQLVLSVDGVQPVRAWSGPLTITAPGLYTGNWRSLDASKPAVRVAAKVKGVIVENARVASMGNGIEVGAGAEVEVRGTRGWGLHPMTQDASNGKFISAGKPSSVVLEHSYAESWLFIVYVDGQLDAAQKKVVVRFNRMRNVQGRQTNVDGTYKPLRFTAGGVAHAVQLNGVSSCASADIGWNEISQEPSIGFSEDIINLYQSSGTAAAPILVHDNVVYGGYATEPGKPPGPGGEGGGAYAGCGIISDGADPGGNEASNGHSVISNNIVISTTNCGIGIAGGSDVHVHDNRMISAGVLDDGTVIWANNVGGYLWKQYATSFHGNVMDHNYAGWINAPGNYSNHTMTPANNPFWFPDDGFGGSRGVVTDQTFAPTPITVQTERDEYQLFWARAHDQAITVGPP